MKKFSVCYALEELDSFVRDLDEGQTFKVFSFEDAHEKNGQYVLFSFLPKKSSEKTLKIMKVIDSVPLPYLLDDLDKPIFTILCFVLKNEIQTVEIYGVCNINVISGVKQNYNNTIQVSTVVNSGRGTSLVFPPDLDSLSKVFSSIKNVDANHISVETPLIIRHCYNKDYKWELSELLHRLNFREL